MPRDHDKFEPGEQKNLPGSDDLFPRWKELKLARPLHDKPECPKTTTKLAQKERPPENSQHPDKKQKTSLNAHLHSFDGHAEHSSSASTEGQELNHNSLREWFHSSSFNCCDGMDDYDQDFNAYQPLKDLLTADMRHQMERHRKDHKQTAPEPIESEVENKGSAQPREKKHLAAMPPDVGFDKKQASTLKLASKGRVLIIGNEAMVMEAGLRLNDRLSGILLINSGEFAGCGHVGLSESAILPLIRGKITEIDGFFGNFTVSVEINNKTHSVASLLDLNEAGIDLILDLDSPSHIQYERLPLGYFAPGNDSRELNRTMNELVDMVGEFEKPRFIFETRALCVHHRSGFRGCSLCIGNCPSNAIHSKGDTVEINHHLCQGCGICAALCPTGALVNGYLQTNELLNNIRRELECTQPASFLTPAVVFHEPETSSELLMQISSQWAESAIQLSVEDIGAIGMDIWLAALAYGADRVVLVSTSKTTPGMRKAIEKQIDLTSLILKGMGFPAERVILFDDVLKQKITRSDFNNLKHQSSNIANKAATFSPTQDRRKLIRLAIQHLYDQSVRMRSRVSLPEGSSFGAIRIDKNACTFCMACVQICPTSAITGGIGEPQINFIETQCIQCGLCRQACPEKAIALYPRIVFDRNISESQTMLNQDGIFSCICCGKPFAPVRMIERMENRLEGHWMYHDQTERQRLKMCSNCRLQDIYDRQRLEQTR
jgi:ferredoxin